MKPFIRIVFFLLTIFLGFCTTVKNTGDAPEVVGKQVVDSTEYELVVNDIHFDQWYLLNYSEARDRSEEFYRSQNLVAVSRWNEYYNRTKYPDIIDSYLNYQSQIDYGLELNRKLYWYFKFVEDYYNVKIFY